MTDKNPSWLTRHLALLIPESMKAKYQPEGFYAAFEETKLACESVYAKHEAKNRDSESVLISFASVQVAAEKGIVTVGRELGLEADESREYAYRLLAERRERGEAL